MFDDLTWRGRLNEMKAVLMLDRKHLLAGEIGALARLDGRREAVQKKLMAMPEEIARKQEAALRGLRKMARRNHRLLKAYLDGARDASLRLRAADRAGADISAYRRDGSKVSLASPPPTRQTRA